MTDEHFMANGQPVSLTLTGYRDWFARNERIGTLKTSQMEYCVGKLLNGLESQNGTLYRIDYDDLLTDDGIHVGLRWAEWLHTTDAEKRNAVSFPLRFSRWPDAVIFGLHDTSDRHHPVLDLDAWDFFTIPGAVLRRFCDFAERIPLPVLISLSPVWSDYNGIPEALAKALDA